MITVRSEKHCIKMAKVLLHVYTNVPKCVLIAPRVKVLYQNGQGFVICVHKNGPKWALIAVRSEKHCIKMAKVLLHVYTNVPKCVLIVPKCVLIAPRVKVLYQNGQGFVICVHKNGPKWALIAVRSEKHCIKRAKVLLYVYTKTSRNVHISQPRGKSAWHLNKILFGVTHHCQMPG